MLASGRWLPAAGYRKAWKLESLEALCHEPEARNPILDHRLRGWGPVVLYVFVDRSCRTCLDQFIVSRQLISGSQCNFCTNASFTDLIEHIKRIKKVFHKKDQT